MTADFYDETGRHARWLGALHGNTDPESLRGLDCGRLMLEATDPMTFADAVVDVLDVFTGEGLGQSHHPSDGWPWSWPDSRSTDWVYTVDRGRAWVITGRIWSYAMPHVDLPPRRQPAAAAHKGPESTQGLDRKARRHMPNTRDLLAPQPRCPDCEVATGQPHVEGCDVARCLRTGLQRLSCERKHNCGNDTWSGRWPGEADCERLGWMIGPGLPDLNRLLPEATWNPATQQWDARA